MKSLRKNFSNKAANITKLIISISIGLALLFVGITFVDRMFKEGNYTDTFSDLYYVEDSEFDVFFFGTSHVYTGVSPMQLWEDYGITAYDIGIPASPLPVTYAMLKNTLKYKKPKIAMLEVYQNEIVGFGSPNIKWINQFFDFVPLSIEKYNDAKAYSDDKDVVRELMFPLSSYHNRWTDIKGNMIKSGFGIDTDKESFVPITKRAELIFTSVYKSKYANALGRVASDEYDKEHYNDKNAEYIKKFVKLCLDNDIIPIVYLAPFDASKDMQLWGNAYLKAGEDAGAVSLNIINENIINPYTDYQDNNHLNISGETKVTDYLGRYLTENYELKDKRDNPDFQSWNECYDSFREQYIHTKIKDLKEYQNCLVFLNEKSLRAELEYTSAHDIENADKAEKMLIEQLGDRITCKKASKIIIEDKDNINKDTGKPKSKEVDIKLTIYDAKTGERIVTKYYKNENKSELVMSE